MREKKISILCIQEMHLTDKHERQIGDLFSRRLVILNSSDPEHPGSSAGVAFIINRELLNTLSIKLTILILGRAIALSINWHNEKTINILNIYVPNNLHDHEGFWNQINTRWRSNHLGQPDFVMEFRLSMNIQDTWRHTFPNKRQFTYSSNTNTLSCLERIYSSPAYINSLCDWNTHSCTAPTDHLLVLLKFAPLGIPHIGKGRWSWPLGLLSDESLLDKLTEIRLEMQHRIENCTTHRTPLLNPQTEWELLKNKMTESTKASAKSPLARINQRIKQLTKDLTMTTNSDDIDTSEDRCRHRIILEKHSITSKRKGTKIPT
ncbi:hypothetical protein BDR03DRAFT_935951 [Suillus americanus]|nr:hypothetical protein BDR03DRAFT_935951 [Suillus americanus]